MDIDSKLLETLRTLDAGSMSAREIIQVCKAAVPHAQAPEIAAALRVLAAEDMREADALEQHGRKRSAGIADVVDGGRG